MRKNSGNKTVAIQYLSELDSILIKVNAENIEEKDFLKSHLKAQIFTEKLIANEIVLRKSKNPSLLVKELEKLSIEYEEFSKRAFGDIDFLEAELFNLTNSERQLVGIIETTSVNEYFDNVPYRLNDNILKVNQRIYDKLIPNKTYYHLQDYLDNNIKSKYAYKAFKDLFYLNTLDGEIKTILQIEREMEEFGIATSYRQFYEQLKSDSIIIKEKFLIESGFGIYEEIIKQFERKDFKLTESQQHSLKKYVSRVAPKLSGLTGIKFLIKQSLIEGDYEKALSTVEGYEQKFCNSSFIESCQEYKKLYDNINSKKGQVNYFLNKYIGDVENISYSKLGYVLSSNGNYLATIPTTQDFKISIFSIDTVNQTLEFSRNGEAPIGFNSYHFKTPRLKTDKESTIYKEGKNDITKVKMDSKTNLIHSDFFIYDNSVEREKIAFFVSTMDNGRNDVERGKIKSPWPIVNALSLQEKRNNVMYNGRSSGNANTDIYYSYYDYGRKKWNSPVHLGGIVNTRFSERTPFFDGNYLYFSSEGHGSIGGFDVFRVPCKIEQNGTFSISNQPENYLAVNSAFDELFYKQSVSGLKVLNSNREGRFEIFSIENSKKKIETKKKTEIKDPARLKLNFDCDESSVINLSEATQPSIQITGTVYELLAFDQAKILPDAEVKITVRDPDALIYNPRGKSSNFNSNDEGKFFFRATAGADLTVTIKKMDEDQNRIINYLSSVDRLCDLDEEAFSGSILSEARDYIAERESDIKKFRYPIFFEFNKDLVNMPMNNLSKIDNALEDFVKDFYQDDSNKFFLIVGFADEIGGLSNGNCQLSLERAKAVKELLRNYGLKKQERFVTIGLGSTNIFDNEETSAAIFPNRLTGPFNRTIEEKKMLQLNRRVEILLCNDVENIRACLENSGLEIFCE